MLMMRGLCGPRFTQRPGDAHEARPPWASSLHRGRLMLMTCGLCGARFTKRPGDADDAPPLWAQVYTEAG